MGEHRLVGTGERVAVASVQLDTAAHHDVLERAALGSGADEGVGGGQGEGPGEFGSGAGIGLPHREVDEHMRIEGRDHLDDAVAIGGFDAQELGAAETTARRVDIDPEQRSHPGFVLEHRGDERAELASHPAHEQPLATHGITLALRGLGRADASDSSSESACRDEDRRGQTYGVFSGLLQVRQR